MEVPFTIWKFRGVSIPQEIIVARRTEPIEPQSEYQVIVGRVYAWSAKQALQKYKMENK